MAYDYRHKGRESLWELSTDEKYVLRARPSLGLKSSGKLSAVYDTENDSVVRFALKDIEVFPYDKNVVFDETQTPIAVADHVNIFRRPEGIEYLDLDNPDADIYLLATPYHYTKPGHGEAVSLKVYADVNVRREWQKLYAQLRILNSEWVAIPDKEEVVKRVDKASRHLERLDKILDTFEFIPWLSRDDLMQHRMILWASIEQLKERRDLLP